MPTATIKYRVTIKEQFLASFELMSVTKQSKLLTNSEDVFYKHIYSFEKVKRGSRNMPS